MIWSSPQSFDGAQEDRRAMAAKQARARLDAIASNEAIAGNIPKRATKGRRLPVLVVAHNDHDAAQVLMALRAGGFDVRHCRVCELDALQKTLAESHWELVVSDFHMPTWSGLDALRTVRANHPTLPVILVCGAIGEDAAAEAIREGANDCISRGQLQARLARSVQRELDRSDALLKPAMAHMHSARDPRQSDTAAHKIDGSALVSRLLDQPHARAFSVKSRFDDLSTEPDAFDRAQLASQVFAHIRKGVEVSEERQQNAVRNPAQCTHDHGEGKDPTVDGPAQPLHSDQPDQDHADFTDSAHADASADWQFVDLRDRFDITLKAISGKVQNITDLLCQLIEVPAVECAASEIGQLFEHLLVVAARATDPQRGTVAIRNGTDGSRVWFEITIHGNGNGNGNGDGIDAAPDAGGAPTLNQWMSACNGPELSDADAIVRRHNGTMSVHSAIGHASSFRVTLPIVQPVLWENQLPITP